MIDGRNIDLGIGTLSGEGAAQGSSEPVAAAPPLWPALPPPVGDPSYYDRPVVKKSPWTWDIPAYYYTGGVSGGAMILGGAATLLNRQKLENLVITSRWVGTIGGAASSIFLIHDLGRPSRFLNMLRVFRPTSPMSVGAWILVGFSSLAGLSTVALFLPRRFEPLGDTAAVLGGIFGLGLSGYTGVLLANTAVPLWHQPHRLLPIMFMASGATSAGSLFDLLGGDARQRRATRIFGIAGKIVECCAAELVDREVGRVPEVAKPLLSGVSGHLWQAGKMLTVASLLLALVPRAKQRTVRISGILGTVGALCMRFGIHYAGQRSAQNPRATFHQQRQGLGAMLTTGTAAITGPGGERAVTPR